MERPECQLLINNGIFGRSCEENFLVFGGSCEFEGGLPYTMGIHSSFSFAIDGSVNTLDGILECVLVARIPIPFGP